MTENSINEKSEALLFSIPADIRFIVNTVLNNDDVISEIGDVAESYRAKKVKPKDIMIVLDSYINNPLVNDERHPLIQAGYVQNRSVIREVIEMYSLKSDRGMELVRKVKSIF